MKTQRIEISAKTIVFTVLFLISLYLLWSVRSVIILFFFCFVSMEILNPSVSWLEKYKIPRPLAILMLYLLILFTLSFALAAIVPILIEQTSALVNNLPRLLQNTHFLGVSAIDWSSQLKILENLPTNIAKTALSIFSNVFMAFVFFVITFYLLMERKNLNKLSFVFFGPQGKQKFLLIVSNLEKRLGSWFNAEMVLMTIIGLVSYLGYLVLGLRYAVPLAIVAGLLEIVPNIGPTVSTVLAATVALTISPLTAGLTILWGIIIQQLENNFIVPKIMNKSVGLHPLVTILLLLTGASLAGVPGAIFALPLYLTLESIFKVVVPPRFKQQ
ncbi:AI-2E family transporter [Patescibacteria group bacterium]|nr:AI-2E family transporter [Patescibacteria group bacterium]